MVAIPADTGPRRSARAMGLICGGHFFSHFYMLLLPPLFPVLTEVYGVGFTELGLVISAYSLATGLVQAPVGFLVDRYGARALLVTGLLLQSLAFACIGLTESYLALVMLMAVAGVANSVFHPCDYAILNASVEPARMGRAFSLHTFAAHLGNAAGPLTVLALVGIMGVHQALLLCGLAGVGVALAIAAGSNVLSEASGRRRRTARSDAPVAPAAPGTPLPLRGVALLLSTPILLGFLFYACTSMFNRGMTGFGVSTVHLLHDVPLAAAGVVLSGYLLVSPVGVLAGGWLADRTDRHGLVATLGFLVIAASAVALATLPVSLGGATALFALVGFSSGLVTPSRDMVIRAVTPPGEMGKVFGFVSTGLSVGGVLAPPLYGLLLDRDQAAAVFWVVAGIALASIVSVTLTSRRRLPAEVLA